MAASWVAAAGAVFGALNQGGGGTFTGPGLGSTLGSFGFLRQGAVGAKKSLFDDAINDYLEFLADEENFADVRQRGLAGIGQSFERLQENLRRDTAFGFGRGGALSRNSAAFTTGIAEANFEAQLRQQETGLQLAKGGEIRAIQNFLTQASQIEAGIGAQANTPGGSNLIPGFGFTGSGTGTSSGGAEFGSSNFGFGAGGNI